MCVMAQLERDLPLDLLEGVLALLPAHTLCRSRLVCKAWNHLTTLPGFLSLRARTSRQASSVLIMPKCVINFQIKNKKVDGWAKEGSPWTMLDIGVKQLYNLSNPFQIDFMMRAKRFPWHKTTVAADRGLVYVVLRQNFGVNYSHGRHLIYNLVTNEYQQIAAPSCKSYEIVVMLVEKANLSYKIIAMKAYEHGGGREEICVYDSSTMQWKELGEHLPRVNMGFFGEREQVFSSIFFKGIFYTLVFDFSTCCSKLYSCNLETGEWSNMNVAFPDPSHEQDKLQLVVSLGRLFCVEYTSTPWRPFLAKRNRKFVIKVTIWEILLATNEVKKVVQMPKFSKYATLHQEYGCNVLVALGCGDSIVISTMFGRNGRWDLLEKRWHELPSNTKTMEVHLFRGIFASVVDY